MTNPAESAGQDARPTTIGALEYVGGAPPPLAGSAYGMTSPAKYRGQDAHPTTTGALEYVGGAPSPAKYRGQDAHPTNFRTELEF